MVKSKNLAKQVDHTKIVQIAHNPLNLIPCTTGDGKFETMIQGKTITAYFAKKPDDNALKLVKQILIDSHTNNFANPMRTQFTSI